ncbi:MAG TPA: anti-sigma factor [Armatimonadota bacterium]|jgi:hypothetical protein
MSVRRDCPDREALARFRQGELGRAERRRVQEHVATCSACAEHVAAERALSALLAQASAPAASPDLPARIRRQAQSATPLAPLTCRQAHRLLELRLDGVLAGPESERLEAHLGRCAPCLRRLRQTEALLQPVRARAARPVAVPAYLRRHIMAAVADAARTPHRAAPRRVPLALGAAGAALLLALTVWGLSALRPSTPAALVIAEQPAAGAPTAPAQLTGTPTATPAQPSTAVTAATPAAGREFTRRAGNFFRSLLGEAPVAPPAAPVLANVPPPSRLPVAPPAGTPRAPELAPAMRPEPAPPPPAPVSAPPPAPPAPPAPAAPVLAAIPSAPAPAPAPRVPEPAAKPAPSRQVVASSPPQAVRQLRWTPAQSSSVLVFRREPAGGDPALAQASQALNQYGQRLRRTENRGVVIAR